MITSPLYLDQLALHVEAGVVEAPEIISALKDASDTITERCERLAKTEKERDHWMRLCTEEQQGRFEALRAVDVLKAGLRSMQEDAGKYRDLCR